MSSFSSLLLSKPVWLTALLLCVHSASICILLSWPSFSVLTRWKTGKHLRSAVLWCYGGQEQAWERTACNPGCALPPMPVLPSATRLSCLAVVCSGAFTVGSRGLDSASISVAKEMLPTSPVRVRVSPSCFIRANFWYSWEGTGGGSKERSSLGAPLQGWGTAVPWVTRTL